MSVTSELTVNFVESEFDTVMTMKKIMFWNVSGRSYRRFGEYIASVFRVEE
jgi:hypothetical protein